MSLLNSQTIFSILFTLLIGVALYYYIRYKTRVLELSVREQAKVLQSVIMNMNNMNNENIMNTVQNRSHEEALEDAVTNDMKKFRQVTSNSELINVSDDSESEFDDDDDDDNDDDDGDSSSSSDDSSSGSESGSDDDDDNDSEHGDETYKKPLEDVTDNSTRKIVFNGGNDCHIIEHLDGPDVKVIELTHPLYPKNENEVMNGHDDDDDDEDDTEDDGDAYADEEEGSDNESMPSELDIEHENHENHEIKENVVTNEVTNQIQNHSDLETETETISADTYSLDNISVKAVFKTKENKDTKDTKDKESEPFSDYNSMNVQSLRQHLKNKLSSEGSHMSEASINKLTKKELIKHLSQML